LAVRLEEKPDPFTPETEPFPPLCKPLPKALLYAKFPQSCGESCRQLLLPWPVVIFVLVPIFKTQANNDT
jgi:hypothetical protein